MTDELRAALAERLARAMRANGAVFLTAEEAERLRRIEAAARRREEAEERYADAETAYNESHKPTFTRKFLQIDRLATERAEAVLALRAALTGAPDGREPEHDPRFATDAT